jgi:PIN domain-containing protein
VIQLTESIAYLAADSSLRHGLAMADAIVYATAKDQEAEVVTGDADLKDLLGVVYVTRGGHTTRRGEETLASVSCTSHGSQRTYTRFA